MELCPRCRSLRGMRVSSSRRTVKDPAGKERVVVTQSYHCASCHAFVRSEEFRRAAPRA